VPKPEDVQFAYIDTGTSIGYQMPADGEDAQKIIALHKMILETGEDYTVARYQSIALRYVLQDGRTVDRTYKVPLTADMKQAMRSIFSTPQYVLGIVNWDKFATSVYRIYVEGEIVSVTSQKALLDAVKKDFDEGSLSTVWALHEDVAYTVGLEIAIRDGNGDISENYVTIYSDARHTVQWLKDHDMLPEYIGDKYY
jgi:hypothetical protein